MKVSYEIYFAIRHSNTKILLQFLLFTYTSPISSNWKTSLTEQNQIIAS